MVPAPQSRATSSVSLSIHATVCLDRGSTNPPATNLPVFRLNSRSVCGILATGGERNQAQLVTRIEAVESLLDPFLIVLFGQRVVVQHRSPMRLRSEVVGERGAPQNTSHMLGVLPGVVDISSVQRGDGQPVRGLQHLERSRLQVQRNADQLSSTLAERSFSAFTQARARSP